jgi:hyperosmotically inducible protein
MEMIRLSCFIAITLVLGSMLLTGQAGDRLVVGFVLDGPWERNQEFRSVFETNIARELGNSRVHFPSEKRRAGRWTRPSVANALNLLLDDPEVDLVITLGVLSSHEALERRTLPKPVIAARVVGSRVLDLPSQDSPRGRVSGVSNLSYITIGDLDLFRSIAKFQEIRRFRKVSLLLSDAFRDLAPNLEQLIQQELARAGIRDSQILFVRTSIASAVASLSRQSEAVIITLLPQLDTADHATLLGAFQQMNLPVFSAGGRTLVQLGALAGWGPADAVDQVAGRVASNLKRIVEGEKAESLPVRLNVQPQLAINLETAATFGISPQPGWQDAMLVMETIGAGATAPSMAAMTPVQQASANRLRPPSEITRSQVDILEDIRRRIFGLRDFSAFDAINPKVVGNGRVVLLGYVFRPTLRTEAERVVSTIKGVRQVDNQLEVLPASDRDNKIRVRVFGAVYGHPALKSYNPGSGEAGVDSKSLPRGPHPILILVKNGNVALIGQVSSSDHRKTAEVQARSISGVYSVENYLKVG